MIEKIFFSIAIAALCPFILAAIYDWNKRSATSEGIVGLSFAVGLASVLAGAIAHLWG